MNDREIINRILAGVYSPGEPDPFAATRERFTTRPPAIDPNSMQSVAGQVAPTVRREDLRPLPTRQEQEREYARLQQSPREAPAYQAPMNQFADAGNQGLEMTGLPSIRRSAAAFADNRPREGIEQGAMGALSLATLGVGGRSAMPGNARPPMRAPMRSIANDDRLIPRRIPEPTPSETLDDLIEGPFGVRRAPDWAPDEWALSRRPDGMLERPANSPAGSPPDPLTPYDRALLEQTNPRPEVRAFEPRPGALRPPVRNPMRPEMPPIEARPVAPDAGPSSGGSDWLSALPPPRPGYDRWYHGSGRDFDRFSLDPVRATGEPDIAVALSNDPRVAAQYGSRVYAVDIPTSRRVRFQRDGELGRGEHADLIGRARQRGHRSIELTFAREQRLPDGSPLRELRVLSPDDARIVGRNSLRPDAPDGSPSPNQQFTIRTNEARDHVLEAVDRDGRVVGYLDVALSRDGNYAPGSGPYAHSVHVNERSRRQGVATALYQEAERRFGRMVPSDNPSPDAQAFWNSFRPVADGSPSPAGVQKVRELDEGYEGAVYEFENPSGRYSLEIERIEGDTYGVVFDRAGESNFTPTGDASVSGARQTFRDAIAAIRMDAEQYGRARYQFHGFEEGQQRVYEALARRESLPGYSIRMSGRDIVIERNTPARGPSQ